MIEIYVTGLCLISLSFYAYSVHERGRGVDWCFEETGGVVIMSVFWFIALPIFILVLVDKLLVEIYKRSRSDD